MGASPIAYSRAIFGWFDALRGRATGVMLAGAAVCAIVVPPVAQMLIRAAGWRIAWLVLGMITLTAALPVAMRFIRDRSPARSSDGAAAGVSVRDALRSRVFRTVLLVVFSATLASNGAIVHIVALLADRGVPLNRAALALSAIGAASLVGRLFTGWLLDRVAPARVSVLMLTIGAAGAFLLAAAHSLPAGVAAALCIGFGSGGELDVIPYLLSRAFGLRSLSTLYGFNWTAWGWPGRPVRSSSAAHSTRRVRYTTALLVLGCITLAAAGLMMTLPALMERESSVSPALG